MKIEITKKALKSWEKIQQPYHKKIMDTVLKLPDTKYKKLVNKKFFSTKVGYLYRIIFEIKDNKIIVLRIAHRKDVYKKL